MIFPAALISVLFLISASLGSEESCYLSEEQEDQCASVCYPIVKPLLRYFEKTNEKDIQLSKCKSDNSELHKKYSNLLERHSEVLDDLKDSEVKYERLLSKQQALKNQKNAEIEQLKDQISDLKKTSELAMLTNQFREDIAKLGEIIKIGGMNQNNQTNSDNHTKNMEVETGEVVTTPLPNTNNKKTSKTETIDLPDPCPRSHEPEIVLREIQLPGSDSFKVVCESDYRFGSGWLKVYGKLPYSKIFNRTYEDYERGFGDVGPLWNEEFFIGLTRLHILTKGNPHEVFLETYLFENKICGNFVVGDRQEGYEVKNIDNCTGDDVWMVPKQGSKFSTFDRDEDGVPDRNLAKEWDFGWWFNHGMSPEKYRIEMYIRRTG